MSKKQGLFAHDIRMYQKSWYQVTSTWAIARKEKRDLSFGFFFCIYQNLTSCDKLFIMYMAVPIPV